MTEAEQAAVAQLVLAKLREDEADLMREISHMNARLEITREVIKALSGSRPPGRPRGSRSKGNSDPTLDLGTDAPPA